MVTTKQQIRDIAMNLTRIGNWAADGFEAKHTRIIQFLDQTKTYVHETERCSFAPPFQQTMNTFVPEFYKLYNEGIQAPVDIDTWAEKMMTWGNILTHRSSLLS